MAGKTDRAHARYWESMAGAWVPVLVFMAAIFVLSAQPDLPSPPIPGLTDKVEHATAYMILGMLVFRAAMLKPVLGLGPYIESLAIASIYGISDEIHQMYVPGRTADFLDWLADVIGICVGLVVISLARKIFTNRGR